MYVYIIWPIYSISFLRFTFLEISFYCIYQKTAICLELYFITHIKCYYKLHLP